MLKISTAIQDIVGKNPFLVFGFHNRLFNLTSLGKFLKPSIEARTKKEIKETAILMNLSRLQKKIKAKSVLANKYEISDLTVNYNLCVLTYYRRQEIYNKLFKFYSEVQDKNEFMALSQGNREITVLLSESSLGAIQKKIKEKPKYFKKNLCSLGINFQEKYLASPGFLFYLTQQLTMQNINIREVSSTSTELIFYIDYKDMRIAFETLSSFVKR
jgi:aspartokinase